MVSVDDRRRSDSVASLATYRHWTFVTDCIKGHVVGNITRRDS
jgi:hypothetical protein